MNRHNDPLDYQGEEHRQNQHYCIHESDWGRMTASVESLDKRINGSLHEMEKHMMDGDGWRKALVGIIVSIFLQIITFAYLWGVLTTQVGGHEKRLCNIEIIEQEAQKIRSANTIKIQQIEKQIENKNN
jgi:hypothetical protein